ncbi:MAG: hypothetical protein ACI8QQ_002675 [Psychroserpens sp.]
MINITNVKQKKVSIVLFLIGLFVLTFSYTNNGLHALSKGYFSHFQTSSEGLIINRVVKNRSEPYFDKGGLPGWFNPAYPFSRSKSYAYYLYTQGENHESFSFYKTHHGTQALIYSVLDQYLLSFLSPSNRFYALHLITAFVNSLVFMLLIWQLKRVFELKKITLLLLVFSMAFAQFLVPFGNNLWWAVGSFYIPFIICLWISNKGKSNSTIILYAAIAMFLKYLFTGYEFITTIWIMSLLACIITLPTFNIKQIIKATLYPALGFLFATITSMTLIVTQIRMADGTWKAGWDHLIFSFLKRSHGNSSSLPEVYAASLDAQLFPVIKNYFTTVWLDISHLIGDGLPIFLRVIKWWEVVALFLVILTTNLLLNLNQKLNRIAILTGLSFLAPFSWLIIFKGHSYIHQHMNHIIWWMPTSFFIVIYISESMPAIWTKLKTKFHKRTS